MADTELTATAAEDALAATREKDQKTMIASLDRQEVEVRQKIRALEVELREISKQRESLCCKGQVSDGYETSRCGKAVYLKGYCRSCYLHIKKGLDEKLSEAREVLSKIEEMHREHVAFCVTEPSS